MKKILSGLIALSLMLSNLSFTVFAEDDNLSVKAPDEAVQGEIVKVSVNIPEGTNAVSGSFNLVYDNTAFEIVSCEAGSIVSDRNPVINKNYTASKIRMNFNSEVPVEEGGAVMEAQFRVLSGASGAYSFDVEKVRLYDENYSLITINETASAKISIINNAKTGFFVNCPEKAVSGDEITVTAEAENTQNISGGSFNLVYDNEKLEIVSSTAGDAIKSFTKQINTSYAANKIRLTWAGFSPMTKDGTLMTVVFKVKDGVLASADFGMEKISISDSSGLPIAFSVSNASVEISCTHSFMEWCTVIEAGCTTSGEESYSCGCGYTTEKRTTAPTGHVEKEWVVALEATCDAPGVMEYTCLKCLDVSESREVPPHGHSIKDVVIEPTKEKDGYTTHTCTVCGYSYTDTPTEALGYTVSYDANGGEGAPDTLRKKHSETVYLSSDIPHRTGYTFLGWSESKDSTVSLYPAGAAFDKNCDTVLYAVWSINSYKITYVVDGAVYAVGSYNYQEMIEAVAEPSKEGYLFSGWSTIPVTMPDEDVTITGSFTIKMFRLTLNSNYNDITYQNELAPYKYDIIINESIPVREGYVFIGYSKSDSAKNAQYQPGDIIVMTQDVNLYAVWNEVWQGESDTGFAGGKGLRTNPYRIENAAQLSYMRDMVNSGDEALRSAYYIVTNNIRLNDVSNIDNWQSEAPKNVWEPAGTAASPFLGVFDANGYTISGLYMSDTSGEEKDNYYGLFGYADGAVITNLTLKDSLIQGYNTVSGVCAYAKNSTLKNIRNHATVKGNNFVGGVAAVVEADNGEKCLNAENHGEVSGVDAVGGVAGTATNAKFEDCINTAAINGTSRMGGIVGAGVCVGISGCDNEGDIMGDSAKSLSIGGIIGSVKGANIERCQNAGKITAFTCDFGGIAGFAGYGTTITQSSNYGIISGNGTSGGIVGAMYYKSDAGALNYITDCVNGGRIFVSGNNIGGICGYLLEYSYIERCISHGKLNTSGSNTGAVTGYCEGGVDSSYYLKGIASAVKGTALTYNQMQVGSNFKGFTEYAQNTRLMSDTWVMGSSPYAQFPSLKNANKYANIPIELRDAEFNEHIYAARTFIKGKNEARDSDEMILFDSANTKTGTNSYGCEAVVDVNNEVIAIEDGNSTVPDNGFVLSGDGVSKEWLRNNIAVGDKVYYNEANSEIKVYKKNPTYTYTCYMPVYLPTPHKDGSLFAGWVDEKGNFYQDGASVNSIEPLVFSPVWYTPEEPQKMTFRDNEYLLFDKATSWDSAKEYCEQLGGHLVTLDSKEENDAVKELAASGNLYAYYIGGHDKISEDGYEWVNGEPMTYTNMDQEQPGDEYDGYDIMCMKKETGTWIEGDEALFGVYGFICEFDNFMPAHEIEYKGRKYQRFDNAIGWEYAKVLCEKYGGHLATITSEEENEIVKQLVTENLNTNFAYYYLGGTDINSEGDFEWVTGEEFSYTNWLSGQPDNSKSREHYLNIYNSNDWEGLWNDLPKSYASTGFILEFEPPESGNINGIEWSVEDEWLILSGEGRIGECEEYPWQYFTDSIEKIRVGEGITEIGKEFNMLTNVEMMEIPKTLEKIGEEAVLDFVIRLDYAGSMYNWSKLEISETALPVATIIAAEYSIIYDGLGVENVKCDESLIIAAEKPVNGNHKFLGWNSFENRTEAEYLPGDEMVPYEDTTLYPVWGAEVYEIKYVTAAPDDWSEWSEWASTKPEPCDNVFTEKGYRGRNKEWTTSSTTKKLSGWEYYRTEESPGLWIDNGKEYMGSFETVSKRREVKTEWVPPVMKTQYHYYRYVNLGKNDIAPSKSTGTFPILEEKWSDYTVAVAGLYKGYYYYQFDDEHSIPRMNRWYRCDGSVLGAPNDFTREVEVIPGYTRYFYRDVNYIHRFCRYTDWSEVTYDVPTGYSDVEVVYRKRSVDEDKIVKTESETNAIVSDLTPTAEGYLFAGWATEPGASVAQYTAGDVMEIQEPVTLYAVWKRGMTGTTGQSAAGGISFTVADSVLNIKGTGKIPDYSQSNSAPWSAWSEDIEKIIISDGITAIGDYAFYGLSSAKEIVIPESVVSIGEYALSNCKALEAVDISGIEKIESYAFRFCFALSQITVSKRLSESGINVFSNCSGLEKVIIADEVTSLAELLFANCGEVDTLIIPKTLTMAKDAFSGTSFKTILYEGTESEFEALNSTAGFVSGRVIYEYKVSTYTMSEQEGNSVLVDVYNLDKDASVAVGVYDENDNLMGIYKKDIGSEESEVTVETATKLESGNTLKIFIWDFENGMTPISDFEEVRIMDAV